MPRDKKATATKRQEIARRKKKNESSDDDASSDLWISDDEEEFDIHEYRKFLAKTFPSKYIENKVKEDSKKRKHNEDDEEVNPKRKNKKRIVMSSSGEEESDEDYEDDEETLSSETLGSQDTDEFDSEEESEYESEDDEDEEHARSKKSGNFNIIFTIGGAKEEDEEYDDEDFEIDSQAPTENEDDPVSSDPDTEEEQNTRKHKGNKKDKKNASKKDNKKAKAPSKEDDNVLNDLKDLIARVSATENKEKEKEKEKDKETPPADSVVIETGAKPVYEDELIVLLKELETKNKNSELVKECIRLCETKLSEKKRKQEKKIEKTKLRNERIFRRVMRDDKNKNNDFDFFNKMTVEEQTKIIKEIKEINKVTRIEKPYRITLLESTIPVVFKSVAMKKINNLRHMDPGSGEFYKIKNWVDTFMRIPFGKYNTLPVNMTDGVEKCHDFMANAQKTLDDAAYGLNDAKMQIMQMLGQLITNPKAIGSAIAIYGPPGTAKTTIVKEGISKILNRPFAFIALGGATDSSFLEGHSYTYEGSTWGQIVQILIDSKCMNPVIYFDELDKISETPKGEEIAGILTHLTDTTQNSQFHDKYFAEIDFDLSKCLFIFSYNDENKVNPILRDRMYRIQTKGYSQKQKTTITNNYLLPRIREQVKFDKDSVIIPDATIQYIIENHCGKEDGVRNLKRCLEIVHTKLNLYRLMRPGSNLFEEDMSLKVEFPFTVTKDIVDKLIKKKEQDVSLYHLYV
jgi:ATP-dependent Lon protease